jgi:hypothetical protein
MRRRRDWGLPRSVGLLGAAQAGSLRYVGGGGLPIGVGLLGATQAGSLRYLGDGGLPRSARVLGATQAGSLRYVRRTGVVVAAVPAGVGRVVTVTIVGESEQPVAKLGVQGEEVGRRRYGIQESQVDYVAGEMAQAVFSEVLYDALCVVVPHGLGYCGQRLTDLRVAQVATDRALRLGLRPRTCLAPDLARLVNSRVFLIMLPDAGVALGMIYSSPDLIAAMSSCIWSSCSPWSSISMPRKPLRNTLFAAETRA